jgi:hypothetical protein
MLRRPDPNNRPANSNRSSFAGWQGFASCPLNIAIIPVLRPHRRVRAGCGDVARPVLPLLQAAVMAEPVGGKAPTV